MARRGDTGARALFPEIERRLDPRGGWSWAIDRLDELFRAGRVPDPALDGFVAGGALVVSAWELADLVGRRVPGPHRRWRGKRFDAAASAGINVLEAPLGAPGRVERFPFRTGVGPSAAAPGLDVLKLDYGAEDNPAWISPLRDELVEVEPGCYVGRFLLGRGDWNLPVGFFTLQR